MKPIPTKHINIQITVNESLHDSASPEFGLSDDQIEEKCAALLTGNVWPWAIVTVTAEFAGLTAHVTREPVQFDNTDDFTQSTLADSMIDDAVTLLNTRARAVAAALLPYIELYKDL